MKMSAIQDARQAARFVSAQVHYSIASRDIEREVVPLSRDQASASCPGARSRAAC
jgi:aryl-alcohol dehydrogenase-like predicted oxidoreductase